MHPNGANNECWYFDGFAWVEVGWICDIEKLWQLKDQWRYYSTSINSQSNWFFGMWPLRHGKRFLNQDHHSVGGPNCQHENWDQIRTYNKNHKAATSHKGKWYAPTDNRTYSDWSRLWQGWPTACRTYQDRTTVQRYVADGIYGGWGKTGRDWSLWNYNNCFTVGKFNVNIVGMTPGGSDPSIDWSGHKYTYAFCADFGECNKGHKKAGYISMRNTLALMSFYEPKVDSGSTSKAVKYSCVWKACPNKYQKRMLAKNPIHKTLIHSFQPANFAYVRYSSISFYFMSKWFIGSKYIAFQPDFEYENENQDIIKNSATGTSEKQWKSLPINATNNSNDTTSVSVSYKKIYDVPNEGLTEIHTNAWQPYTIHTYIPISQASRYRNITQVQLLQQTYQQPYSEVKNKKTVRHYWPNGEWSSGTTYTMRPNFLTFDTKENFILNYYKESDTYQFSTYQFTTLTSPIGTSYDEMINLNLSDIVNALEEKKETDPDNLVYQVTSTQAYEFYIFGDVSIGEVSGRTADRKYVTKVKLANSGTKWRFFNRTFHRMIPCRISKVELINTSATQRLQYYNITFVIKRSDFANSLKVDPCRKGTLSGLIAEGTAFVLRDDCYIICKNSYDDTTYKSQCTDSWGSLYMNANYNKIKNIRIYLPYSCSFVTQNERSIKRYSYTYTCDDGTGTTKPTFSSSSSDHHYIYIKTEWQDFAAPKNLQYTSNASKLVSLHNTSTPTTEVYMGSNLGNTENDFYKQFLIGWQSDCANREYNQMMTTCLITPTKTIDYTDKGQIADSASNDFKTYINSISFSYPSTVQQMWIQQTDIHGTVYISKSIAFYILNTPQNPELKRYLIDNNTITTEDTQITFQLIQTNHSLVLHWKPQPITVEKTITVDGQSTLQDVTMSGDLWDDKLVYERQLIVNGATIEDTKEITQLNDDGDYIDVISLSNIEKDAIAAIVVRVLHYGLDGGYNFAVSYAKIINTGYDTPDFKVNSIDDIETSGTSAYGGSFWVYNGLKLSLNGLIDENYDSYNVSWQSAHNSQQYLLSSSDIHDDGKYYIAWEDGECPNEGEIFYTQVKVQHEDILTGIQAIVSEINDNSITNNLISVITSDTSIHRLRRLTKPSIKINSFDISKKGVLYYDIGCGWQGIVTDGEVNITATLKKSNGEVIKQNILIANYNMDDSSNMRLIGTATLSELTDNSIVIYPTGSIEFTAVFERSNIAGCCATDVIEKNYSCVDFISTINLYCDKNLRNYYLPDGKTRILVLDSNGDLNINFQGKFQRIVLGHNAPESAMTYLLSLKIDLGNDKVLELIEKQQIKAVDAYRLINVTSVIPNATIKLLRENRTYSAIMSIYNQNTDTIIYQQTIPIILAPRRPRVDTISSNERRITLYIDYPQEFLSALNGGKASVKVTLPNGASTQVPLWEVVSFELE